MNKENESPYQPRSKLLFVCYRCISKTDSDTLLHSYKW